MRHSGIGYLLLLMLLAAGSAQATSASEHYAEELVRAIYFEGIPHGKAAAIDSDGAERLAEMLMDPAEKPHHAKILIALGMSQQPGSFEAFRAFLQNGRSGEMDRSEFHAWRVLPTAMGHLARRDERALAWLAQQVQNPEPPHRTYRQHDLPELRHRAAIHGLAVSGTDEARLLLRALRDQRLARSVRRGASTPADRRIQAALALHDRVAREGPASIGAQEGAP